MYRIVTCLTSEHDYRVVLLAAIVCTVTVFASFRIYASALDADGIRKQAWLVLTGFCTAAGIWATHFVAMLAYDSGVPTSYDPVLTILSLLLAAVTTTVGFAIAAGGQQWPTVVQQLRTPLWLSGRFASRPLGRVRIPAGNLRNIWTRMCAGVTSTLTGAVTKHKFLERVRAHLEALARMLHTVRPQTDLFENIGSLVRVSAIPMQATVGGAVIGAGIGAMHFTGMSSLLVAGSIEWDLTLVLASIVVGVTMASAALVAYHHMDRPRAAWIAPGLFVLAICGLHFTAMGAVTIVPDPTVIVSEFQFNKTNLAIAVAGVSVLVMITCVVSVVIEKLNSEVQRRTLEAFIAKERFERALNQSKISVFYHDVLHRYEWGHNCSLDTALYLGKTDSDIMPPATAAVLTALKNNALKEPGIHEGEICIETDKGELWCLVKVSRRTDLHGQAIGTTSVSLDITERKTWEKHLFMLMREVNHRSRNLLAVLSSISSCTAAQSASIQDYSQKFASRLQSLAKSHEIVAEDQWTASSLNSLINAQINAFQGQGARRVQTRGPKVDLYPKGMQNLGLAFHELATNSAKHGALSVPGGLVEIMWRRAHRDGSPVLYLVWREVGGPEVAPPGRKGFGSLLLERVVGAELDGKSVVKYRRNGLVWQTEIGGAHFKNAGAGPWTDPNAAFSRESRLRQQYDEALANARVA